MHMHTDIHTSPITTHTNGVDYLYGSMLEPYSNTSAGNVGTLFQYTYWEYWNPIPLHLLGVLEPYSSTPTGSAGTLYQYTYWECWNPIPVHLLGVLEPLGLLQYTHR